MAYTALENNPIIVDMVQAALDTGWIIDGNIATHDSLNAGSLVLSVPLITGHTYETSYSILTISGGYVQVFAGTASGQQHTQAGIIVENIVATGANPQLHFYATANCQLQYFNSQDTSAANIISEPSTIVYNAIQKKWSDFRSFTPDMGFSLGVNSYTFYKGDMFAHQNGSIIRNNFYGVQYKTIIKMVFNANSSVVKTFIGISYQANELLITTEDGITTSLGQVSELLEDSFLQDTLQDQGVTVNIYATEGLYQSNFLRDKNVDLIEGDPLKGNYIQIELTQTDNNASQHLTLFTIAVDFAKSFQGIR